MPAGGAAPGQPAPDGSTIEQRIAASIQGCDAATAGVVTDFYKVLAEQAAVAEKAAATAGKKGPAAGSTQKAAAKPGTASKPGTPAAKKGPGGEVSLDHMQSARSPQSVLEVACAPSCCSACAAEMWQTVVYISIQRL